MDVNIRIWLVLSLLIASATITSPASRAIQGGESAKGTGFVVALVIQINDTSGTLCSGGLVAPRVVATAAHCVVKRGVLAKSDSILVFTPGSELSSPTAAKVQNIFVPEGYENSSDAGEPNDIAFLVFDRPLGQVTIDTVADQTLVKKVIQSGAVIRLYGYGITGSGQSAAGYPKSFILKPVPQFSLEGFDGKANTYVNYAQEGSGAACNGDSGGPAVATFEGRTILVSVHSSSAGVCSDSLGTPTNWGTIPGEYSLLFEFAKKAAESAAPTATPSASPSVSAPVPAIPRATPTPSATNVKKRTITCIKGKLIKKVTAIKPKCPKGYTVKK